MSNLSGRGQLTGIIRNGGGGSGGTTNYNDLSNKPTINNVELVGNKTTLDLNISYNDLTNKPTIRNVPETTGAELGSVLTHTASGEAWLPVPSELPPVASGDNGDVLTIDNGSLTWAPVSGGSIEYSTTEHVVGKWIDDRNVYEKTINLGNMPNAGSVKTVLHNISNLDFVIDYSSFISGTVSNIKYHYSIPLVSRLSSDQQTAFYISDTVIAIVNGNSSNINDTFNGYFTIRYTKAGE